MKRISCEELARTGYQRVEMALLEDQKQNAFRQRQKAMQLLFEGYVYSDIEIETGISPSEITRIYKRYTTINADGVYWGECALIPGVHLKKYQRKSAPEKKRSEQRGGYSGVLGLLLSRHPEAQLKFEELVLGKTADFVEGKRFSRSQLCADFYGILKEHGVSDEEWPFNEPAGGRRSILNYINRILDGEFLLAAKVLGGHDAFLHAKVGTGDECLIQALRPFDVVQIDAYKYDCITVVKVSPAEPVTVKDIVSRFWMLAAIDTRTTSVLARKTCYSSEIRAEDVVDVIVEAFLGSWTPKKSLEKSGLQYLSGSGMAGYLLREARCQVWGEVALDNAMQHHSGLVHELVLERIGCALNYGQLGRPERRSEVENLFKKVAQEFIHKVPSTTGSNPYSGRASAPEENAVLFEVDVEEFEEALDVYLASYNITPRAGWCYSKSPIEIMSDYLRDENLVWPILPENYVAATQLSSQWKMCTVRGNVKRGARPYIELDGATYTSKRLAERADLISSKMHIKINPEDYRRVEAFTEGGVYFDALDASAGWAKTKHSVVTRKVINRSLRKKSFSVHQGEDIVSAWNAHLRENTSKKNNLELARLRAESDRSEHVSQENEMEVGEASSDQSELDYMRFISLTPGKRAD